MRAKSCHQSSDVLEENDPGLEALREPHKMLEQPTARVFEREHMAGTAERLTGRPAGQEIERPVGIRSLWPQISWCEIFDARMKYPRFSQQTRGRANSRAFLVQAHRRDAVRVGIDGCDRPKSREFEPDVESARAREQRYERWPEVSVSAFRHGHENNIVDSIHATLRRT